jgi:hypothetical protein
MYALLLVMYSMGNLKVKAVDNIFTSENECEVFSSVLHKKLVDTRPSEDAFVKLYCLPLPESV